MKFALVISSLVAAAFAQTINTPESVLSCANHQVTWSGGTPPYTLLVVPGGTTTSGAALETYQNIPCSPFTWFVTEQPNTLLFLRLQDAAGASVTTAQFTIQAGGSTNCTAPTTTSAAGSCAAATTIAGSAPPAAGTTTAAGGGATTAPPSGGATTGASTSRSSSATSTPGAGYSNQVSMAGVVVGALAMGLAVLA